ncbi:MAG: pyroglutamyl-peptidase I [Candidatus Wallbacteria bacterium]|nr:pyroglutamyl-peptidase I [Candidatus Wallbacteria bacterium]
MAKTRTLVRSAQLPLILVTGFKPFGVFKVNPTEGLIMTLADHPGLVKRASVVPVVLPTGYRASEREIARLLKKLNPDAVISFGLNFGASKIMLERIAVNIDDANRPDNARETRQGTLIVPDGQAAYWSTLPLDALHKALNKAGLPAGYSNHAGTYVCNHLFYCCRHIIEACGLKSRSGFIHMPPLPEQTTESSPVTGMNAEDQLAGAVTIIETVARYCR